MAYPSDCLFALFAVLVSLLAVANGQMVPALFIFGDSTVDVGNNNELSTIVKANFPPYGRDFNHTSTGRFCNGKLATDLIADFLRFSSYQSAYLGSQAQDRGSNLSIGANFASAASGYYEQTAKLYQAIPLSSQVDNYIEYQGRLAEEIGDAKASTIFSNGIHLISTGTSDFIQNYYISPLLQTTYTPNQFSNILLHNYAKLVQDLYDLGAKKIGVTSLPPVGCLPAAITLFGSGNNTCVDRLNHHAYSFNQRLNLTSQRLKNRLAGLNLIVFDIYNPLNDLIKNPVKHGFTEARRGCCGTGLLETSFLCNQFTIGTCTNASQYVFWDAFHPSEAANHYISGTILYAGISFI